MDNKSREEIIKAWAIERINAVEKQVKATNGANMEFLLSGVAAYVCGEAIQLFRLTMDEAKALLKDV